MPPKTFTSSQQRFRRGADGTMIPVSSAVAQSTRSNRPLTSRKGVSRPQASSGRTYHSQPSPAHPVDRRISSDVRRNPQGSRAETTSDDDEEPDVSVFETTCPKCQHCFGLAVVPVPLEESDRDSLDPSDQSDEQGSQGSQNESEGSENQDDDEDEPLMGRRQKTHRPDGQCGYVVE